MDDVRGWLASLPFEWTEACPEAIFFESREAYRSPGRHYHTWDHVLDCVEKLRSMPCEAPRAAFLALVFHDAVYVAGRKDNEEQSAILAADVIAEHANLPEAELAAIQELILATRDHHAPKGSSPDLRTVLDIDMSILGAPPEAYEAYAEAVKREWCPAVVTPAQFAAGRMAFLKTLLAGDSIYATAEGRARWQRPALENIARELARLRASRGPWARLGGWLRRLRG